MHKVMVEINHLISTSTSEGDAIITDIRSTTQTTDGRAAEKISEQLKQHII